MSVQDQIDVTFDFRSDTPGYPEKDPDSVSPTLRNFHRLLWSKPLPNGKSFDLDDSTSRVYLHHRSDLGAFYLSSDTLSQSYGNVGRMSHIREQMPADELGCFITKMYSIGNMMVFPGNQIEGKWTINQARGCRREIGDRFDLTLECIRLHYRSQPSPLAECLQRYANFFHLFGDFRGYVDFFLLHDLVTNDGGAVRYFLPFVDFADQSPYPGSIDAFRSYVRAATEFIDARNQRISVDARDHD